MLVSCPFCGDREVSEFVTKGDSAPQRPADGDPAAMTDYVYMRDNPAGPVKEYWYHAAGCRNWLIVERDTRTHDILKVSFAMMATAR
jgi:methylglutamate dehydrogenase subunit B